MRPFVSREDGRGDLRTPWGHMCDFIAKGKELDGIPAAKWTVLLTTESRCKSMRRLAGMEIGGPDRRQGEILTPLPPGAQDPEPSPGPRAPRPVVRGLGPGPGREPGAGRPGPWARGPGLGR